MSAQLQIDAPPAGQPPTKSGAAPLTYVYLCSAPHSGSTLLACLLQSHPEISSVGEYGATFDPQTLHCSCGVYAAVCPFWSRWAEAARREGIEFTIGDLGVSVESDPDRSLLARLYYGQFPVHGLNIIRNWLYPSWTQLQRRSTAVIDKSIRLARLLCRMEGTNVFLDTTKTPLQVRFLARRGDVRVKAISLTRDGRGVVNSLMRHYGTPLDAAIDSWLWAIRNQERAARWLPPENVWHLRIEDLWSDPAACIQSLYAFCGVDPSFTPDSFDPAQRHIVGNGMRMAFTGQIRTDHRWKTEMAPAAQARFEQRAGRVNRSLGYEQS